MSTVATYPGDIQVNGTVNADRLNGKLARSNIDVELLQSFPIDVENWRIWDNYRSLLGAPGSDDLGIGGSGVPVWATSVPYLSTSNSNAASLLQYARTTVKIPRTYVAGQTLKLNFAAGMLSAVCSTSALLTVEAYLSGRNTLISGSQLVTTAAQSLNSLTFAELAYELAVGTLTAGAWLDIRILIATINATASAMYGTIAHSELLCNVRG